MALQFLKAMPEDSEDKDKYISEMEQILAGGYDKLVAFQTEEKGYEWFGESPAVEVLSAYGLM
jgi:replicative superfamily II helicase